MSQGIESNSTNAATSPSMQEEEVRINSVSEFIEKIVQLDKEEGTEIFYRGHADRDWELLPSIFRTPNGERKSIYCSEIWWRMNLRASLSVSRH